MVNGNRRNMDLKVCQIVGSDLATRNGCDNMFKLIEQSQDANITLDFSMVSSISRSFAHEYITKKKLSSKTVSEVNVPVLVEKMLKFVGSKQYQKKPVENNNIKTVTIL
jgi:hypothetical protein